MRGEGTQRRFDFPGRRFDREDRRADLKARMFSGNDAIGYANAVIWFEK